MSDSEVLEKTKKTGAQLVLVYLGAPLLLMGVAWLFNTVHTNSKNSEAMVKTIPLLVSSMDRNTEAIIRADDGNNKGHAIIAGMVYEVKVEVSKSNIRLNMVESECNEYRAKLDECEEQLHEHEREMHDK